MKRGFRLSKAADVKRVRRNGSYTHHSAITVITHPNEGQGLRVAVVAGKSVGGAVQRNRAKRVMRAAIQPLLETLKTDQDLVLLAKPGLLDLKSTEVQIALSELLKKKSSKR